mgnify:CR=1 FL=1
MKKEKMLVKRKSTDNWSFKQIMIFGFAIIVLASIIFMQADNASAAKKKKVCLRLRERGRWETL